jgi:outer membrane protein TolC
MLSARANVSLADVEAELAALEADYKLRGAALRALIKVLKAEAGVSPERSVEPKPKTGGEEA